MSTSSSARDIGAAVLAARCSKGWTQAELAEKAGVSRQWLVAVEAGHERAEIGLVFSVLRALGLELATVPAARATRRTWLTAGDAARAIRDDIREGDTDFALRTLGRFLAELRSLESPTDRSIALAEPPSTGDPRWDTLIGASVARTCRLLGIDAPGWTLVKPLRSWWFPVFDPVLTARTMQRTPTDFSAKGIWLDSHALEVT